MILWDIPQGENLQKLELEKYVGWIWIWYNFYLAVQKKKKEKKKKEMRIHWISLVLWPGQIHH